MPFIPAFMRAVGIIQDRIEYDEERQRYMLTLSASGMLKTAGTSKRETLNMIQAMETKLNNMAVAHTDLSRKVDSLIQVCIDNLCLFLPMIVHISHSAALSYSVPDSESTTGYTLTPIFARAASISIFVTRGLLYQLH